MVCCVLDFRKVTPRDRQATRELGQEVGKLDVGHVLTHRAAAPPRPASSARSNSTHAYPISSSSPPVSASPRRIASMREALIRAEVL